MSQDTETSSPKPKISRQGNFEECTFTTKDGTYYDLSALKEKRFETNAGLVFSVCDTLAVSEAREMLGCRPGDVRGGAVSVFVEQTMCVVLGEVPDGFSNANWKEYSTDEDAHRGIEMKFEGERCLTLAGSAVYHISIRFSCVDEDDADQDAYIERIQGDPCSFVVHVPTEDACPTQPPKPSVVKDDKEEEFWKEVFVAMTVGLVFVFVGICIYSCVKMVREDDELRNLPCTAILVRFVHRYLHTFRKCLRFFTSWMATKRSVSRESIKCYYHGLSTKEEEEVVRISIGADETVDALRNKITEQLGDPASDVRGRLKIRYDDEDDDKVLVTDSTQVDDIITYARSIHVYHDETPQKLRTSLDSKNAVVPKISAPPSGSKPVVSAPAPPSPLPQQVEMQTMSSNSQQQLQQRQKQQQHQQQQSQNNANRGDIPNPSPSPASIDTRVDDAAADHQPGTARQIGSASATASTTAQSPSEKRLDEPSRSVSPSSSQDSFVNVNSMTSSMHSHDDKVVALDDREEAVVAEHVDDDRDGSGCQVESEDNGAAGADHSGDIAPDVEHQANGDADGAVGRGEGGAEGEVVAEGNEEGDVRPSAGDGGGGGEGEGGEGDGGEGDGGEGDGEGEGGDGDIDELEAEIQAAIDEGEGGDLEELKDDEMEEILKEE